MSPIKLDSPVLRGKSKWVCSEALSLICSFKNTDCLNLCYRALKIRRRMSDIALISPPEALSRPDRGRRPPTMQRTNWSIHQKDKWENDLKRSQKDQGKGGKERDRQTVMNDVVNKINKRGIEGRNKNEKSKSLHLFLLSVSEIWPETYVCLG